MKKAFRWLFGECPQDYRVGASLLCRGIGVIYLIALLSWWAQAGVLITKDGLVPIVDLLAFLDQQWQANGQGSRWNLPTLFWMTGASDPAIHLLFSLGVICALFAIAGIAQGPALIGSWIVYLSFVTTGDTFMSFQWDILLLEAGFLAIFLSSWRWRERFFAPLPLSLRRRAALFLCWFLIAKLMFLSGWVKLAWASPSQPEWWPDGTAMLFHYQTQPIPTWTAWWAHQLPEWFHQFSIWPMYFIEIVLPFFIWLGYRLRAFAAAGFAFLMMLILLTGNYTYFNWLTMVLCLPLVADRFWPSRWFQLEPALASDDWKKWLPTGLCAPVFFLLIVLNFQVLASSFQRAPRPLLSRDLSPGWLDALAGGAARFYLCSSYGLFRTMTTTRPEIILEGSSDGIEFRAYDFKWKPDRLDEKPRFVAPHQPRVAWQLWFAALEERLSQRSRNFRWFQTLLVKLLRGDENVQVLFRENPFPEAPPRYLRARLYWYEFTTPEEKKATGHWWKRQEAGWYLQEIRLQ